MSTCFTRERVLERIWGTVWSSGGDPVKVYIRYLRKKLNLTEDDDVIETVRGSGYLLKAS
jgi:DNA-binding response OmpR family regulator